MRAPCVFIKSGCKRTLEHPTCVPRADTAYVRTMHDSASDDKKHSGKAVPFLMPPRRSRGGSRRCRLCPATAVGPATQREPPRRRRAALRRSPLHRQPHRRLPLVALVPCDACNLALSESPRRRAERRVAAPLPELRAQPPVARQRLDALRGRVRLLRISYQDYHMLLRSSLSQAPDFVPGLPHVAAQSCRYGVKRSCSSRDVVRAGDCEPCAEQQSLAVRPAYYIVDRGCASLFSLFN